MPRHDVCIYAPGADSYYDAAVEIASGGAERQTYLLARALSRSGLRVAHVVFPVAEPVLDPEAPVTLVQRPEPPGLVQKARSVWSALSEADASVQIFRGADGTVGVGAAWARARGRRLVFAGANNSDFNDGAFAGSHDPRARMFAAGVRGAHAVVVQTDEQARLAHDRFPRRSVEQINSFVAPAPATEAPAEAFLWVSRLVDYKRPFAFVDLAAALPSARFWMIATDDGGPDFPVALAELRRRAGELDNLEVLDQRPHAELQELITRAVAMVNTSSFEGLPNTWLEGWARGVPALTLSFDPDERIARNGLGVAAAGSWDDFVAGAERLWTARADRGGYSDAVRAYVRDVHGDRVAAAWEALVRRQLG